MFERFTDRARNVLVLAQGQATELGHNYIGTEHLLLGMVLEAEGVAGRVLRSLQVTDAVVRAKVTELTPAQSVSAPSRRARKAPFTPLAKKALELSLQEALGLGHNYIGTEHLLLALTHEGAAKSAAGDDRDGMAARILSELGAEPSKLRGCVLSTLEQITSARSGSAKTGRDRAVERAVAALLDKPEWSPATAEAVADAEAAVAPGATLTTTDLLGALVRSATSRAGKILSRLGLTEQRLAQELVEVPLEGTSDLPVEPVSITVLDRTMVVEDPDLARFLRRADGAEIAAALRRGLPGS